MSYLSTSSTLCDAAASACYFAAAVLPEALECAEQILECQADAGLIDDAGATWRHAHQTLGEAAGELRTLVAQLPADSWTGKDRAAYEGRVEQVIQQLHDAATFAQAGGVTLSAMAYALFAFADLACSVGVLLADTAMWVAAAEATLVGAPEAEAAGTALALECAGVVASAKAMLEGVMATSAGVFTLTEVLDVAEQVHHGSHTVLPTFVQAEISAYRDTITSQIRDIPQNVAEEVRDRLVERAIDTIHREPR